MAQPLKPTMKVVGGPTTGGPFAGTAQTLRTQPFAATRPGQHPSTPNPPGVGGTPLVNPVLQPTTTAKSIQSMGTQYIPVGWTARTPANPASTALTSGSVIPSKRKLV